MGTPYYEESLAKRVMNRVTTPYMPFQWSLNPYRGCSHGCSFCYARETHGFMGLSVDDTFQTHIFVKSNAAEALEKQLDRLARKHHYHLPAMADEIGLLAVGTATDPYQPVEAKAKITRQCLQILADYRVPVTITTRSPLILRDVDVLSKMDVRSINMSVHTLRTDVWKGLEPATPRPEKRLDAVRELVAAGLPAGVFLAPIVPFLTDSTEEMDSVVLAAKQAKAMFVIPSILRLMPEVKSWFFQTVEERFPETLPKLRRLFVESYASKAYTDITLSRARRILEQRGMKGDINYSVPKGDQAPALPAECKTPMQLALPL